MKIVCPTCDANYEVPDAVVTARRPMRCARCNHDWVPGAALDPPAPAAEPEPAPAAVVEPELPPAASVEPEPPPDLLPAHETPEFAALMAQFLPPAETPPAAWEDAPVEPQPMPDEAAPESYEEEAPEPAPPPPVELRPVARLPVPPPVTPTPASVPAVPSSPRQPLVAWAASVALLIVLTGAGVVLRAPVMKAWPPSTRLYAALGLY